MKLTTQLVVLILGTMVGLGSVWALGLPGLILLVIAQPAIAALRAAIKKAKPVKV